MRMEEEPSATGNFYPDAANILRQAIGQDAQFRPGQVEAIEQALKPGSRSLLVQRTGWGKSVVYFVSTKLLRARGGGPTLLVSPLLALMRNQIELAARYGVRAATINSANVEEWNDVITGVERDEIDCLIISPERLGNERFRDTVLEPLQKRIGLLVIDEAHCISDWGHDFRPDYRRILLTASNLDESASILCTTATANDRVISDIAEQLGSNIEVMRGPLMRESLHLRVLPRIDQAERLALLERIIPTLAGSGIVYALTVADAIRIARWLESRGIACGAYYGELDGDRRLELESAFNRNEIKCIVATTALGMGYDKPDVGFVIHFQRPGSIISYYQQIGRAGRAIDSAQIILLQGPEDDEINDYFIECAFPAKDCFAKVVAHLKQGPISVGQLRVGINYRDGDIHKALALLGVHGVVEFNDKRWQLTGKSWQHDVLRAEEIGEIRRKEVEEMRDYASATECRMLYLARALDDKSVTGPCGKCDRCVKIERPKIARQSVLDALEFLGRDVHKINPPKMFPPGTVAEARKRIGEESIPRQGVALCAYGDAGWGRLVREGKYGTFSFSDELIAPSVEAIRETGFEPGWVTWIPSARQPQLVPDFARRLAAALGVEAVDAVEKTEQNAPQKTMQNSTTQFKNVWFSFEVIEVRDRPCLLVDDVVDSGWTLCAVGVKLRQAGVAEVMPFALATARPRSDS